MSETDKETIDKEIIDFILKKEFDICDHIEEIEPKELVNNIIGIIRFSEDCEKDIDYFKLPDDVYALKLYIGPLINIYIIKKNIIKGYSCIIER